MVKNRSLLGFVGFYIITLGYYIFFWIHNMQEDIQKIFPEQKMISALNLILIVFGLVFLMVLIPSLPFQYLLFMVGFIMFALWISHHGKRFYNNNYGIEIKEKQTTYFIYFGVAVISIAVLLLMNLYFNEEDVKDAVLFIMFVLNISAIFSLVFGIGLFLKNYNLLADYHNANNAPTYEEYNNVIEIEDVEEVVDAEIVELEEMEKELDKENL